MRGCIVLRHPGGQRIDSPGELAYEKWTQGQAHFPQISNLWAGVSWQMHWAPFRSAKQSGSPASGVMAMAVMDALPTAAETGLGEPTPFPGKNVLIGGELAHIS